MDTDAANLPTHENNAPLFSIIVPVFNTVGYLPGMLNSVLAQEYPSFEIVLVDDGSTDGSSSLCDDFAAKDQRIRCVHQDNAGVSAARNVGLDNACGRYVWFCDSDDKICRGALNRLAQTITASRPSMVAFPVEQVDDGERRIGLIAAPRPSTDKTEGPLQCGDPLYPYAHVFRRELAENERFDTSLALLEDRDFLYRICWKAAGSIVVIESPLYRYLITRADSAVNSSSVQKNVDATRVQASILRNELSHGYPMPAFEQFANHSLGILSLAARARSRPEDFELVRQGLLEFQNYLPLIDGALKAKYVLAIRHPTIFKALAKVSGAVKGLRGRRLGSTVIVRE